MECLQLNFLASYNGARTDLPPFLGATFRGALGYLLKETACQVRNTPCPECYLKNVCPYVSIFEGLAPDHREILRKYDKIPQPFVLLVPPQTVELNSSLQWGIRLFGPAMKYWPYVIHTYQEVGKRGLGKKKLRYEVEKVCDGKGVTVWSNENTLAAEPVITTNLENTPNEENDFTTLTWRFHTPVQIKTQGQVDGLSIILAGRRRFNILNHFYGASPGDDSEEHEYLEEKQFSTESSLLKPYRFSRFSGRQKRKVQMSGLVGEITITGPWGRSGEWLRHISNIHLGKSTSFGFGHVTWEEK